MTASSAIPSPPADASGLMALKETVERESEFLVGLVEQLRKRIIGQQGLIDRLLVALLTGGHVLVEGVPGLAKTLTIQTLSDAIHADFQRIQFTPDLLPADLIGTLIFNQASGDFTPRRGPVFANLILADEINRAPAKVQSALLEAMQERQVTIGDQTYPLPEPFMVMATQNPIEQEGTYPLPEAQIDRFMLKVIVGYPTIEEERLILDLMTGAEPEEVQAVVDTEYLMKARGVVRSIYMDEKIKSYIIDLIIATRDPARYGVPIENYVQYGASPRATVFLAQAARAQAFLARRAHVIPDDVKLIGPDVLRHRIIITYEAEAEEKTSDDIIRLVFDHIEVP
ncbi:MAG: AAA family ATPase [Proteobacteria bacterium]|nr:AAA family ATPase [Pseudomonadota bacterium]